MIHNADKYRGTRWTKLERNEVRQYLCRYGLCVLPTNEKEDKNTNSQIRSVGPPHVKSRHPHFSLSANYRVVYGLRHRERI